MWYVKKLIPGGDKMDNKKLPDTELKVMQVIWHSIVPISTSDIREKLEKDRIRELESLKENKTLILSLSHDIKTPLSAIDLYTRALRTNLYDSREEKMTAIEGIEKNIFEIKHYVSEITNASREDFLSLEVTNSEVYLSDIMKEIEKYYKDKCRLIHTKFEVAPVKNCIVCGERGRIVEVHQNIIEK